MTTLLERDRTTAAEEQSGPDASITGKRASGLKAWITSLVAVAVVAAGAIVVSLNQADATESPSYRAVGEAEAFARFVPAVATGLSYRSIGEAEAFARFVPAVTTGLSYRSIGEAEAFARFVPAVETGLSYRTIGETEALERFVA